MKKHQEGWGCVYSALNLITDEEYIGMDQTGDPENHRWKHHRKMAATAHLKGYFHRTLKKYGLENFKWTVIWRGPLIQMALKEIYYIKKRCTFADDPLCRGYNMTEGGEGVRASKSVRKKISAAQKRRYKDPAEREKIRQLELTRTSNPLVRLEMSKTRLAIWALKTPKERKVIGAAVSLGHKRRTPEEREVLSIVLSTNAVKEWKRPGFRKAWKIANAAGWAKRTPEDCAATIAKHSVSSLEMWAKRTPEERIAVKAAVKAGNAKRSDVERTATRVMRSASAVKRYATMSSEERGTYWRNTHPNGNGCSKRSQIISNKQTKEPQCQ